MSSPVQSFANLDALATFLRNDDRQFILLYAYNGTGKTRLSMAVKEAGKQGGVSDTLYFNAFTEDLFTWDNDLAGDSKRVLKINAASRFFAGLQELEMENRIQPFLRRYADIDFRINYADWTVSFARTIPTTAPDGSATTTTIEAIKVSRGEENIFIWCFFLAVVQLVLDGDAAYQWVKYLFIDDPISSLDDNNAIAVGSHLAQLLKRQTGTGTIKTIISSHHTLFFNVICNELKDGRRYFLSKNSQTQGYMLRKTNDTPFFHHVATLTELHKAAHSGQLYTYHFTMLRTILEKTATFHGFPNFSACIKRDPDDVDGIMHVRLINILSHGNYSLYEPQEMLEENKTYFRRLLNDFLSRYAFNPELFPTEYEVQPPS